MQHLNPSGQQLRKSKTDSIFRNDTIIKGQGYNYKNNPVIDTHKEALKLATSQI